MAKRPDSRSIKLCRFPLYRGLPAVICNYITEKQLRSDDPLPAEAELAKLFGVSRNSLREAVRSLQVLGILVSRPGLGLFVGQFSVGSIVDSLSTAIVSNCRNVADLLEVRRHLMATVIEGIISSRTDEQIDKLDEIILSWISAVTADNNAYPAELDRAFHEVLLEGVQNKFAARLLSTIWQAVYRITSSGRSLPHDAMTAFGCHVIVLHAFKAGDRRGVAC